MIRKIIQRYRIYIYVTVFLSCGILLPSFLEKVQGKYFLVSQFMIDLQFDLESFCFSPQLKNPLYWVTRYWGKSTPLNPPHIGLVVPASYIGDRQAVHQLTRAMNHLNIHYYVYAYNDLNSAALIHKIVYSILKPDFIFTVPSQLPPWPKQHNYTWNTHHGKNSSFSLQDPSLNDGNPEMQLLSSFYMNFLKYEAFVDSDPSHLWLNNQMEKIGKQPIYEHFMPTAAATAYSRVQPTKLFYCGDNWDKTRKIDYLPLFKKLQENTPFVVYGTHKAWQNFGPSYQGFIPMDDHSLIEKIKQAGIALCLHSQTHNSNGIPSMRVFESAAASAIIITDRNPYIVEHFGDSVLYIDNSSSPEKMYQEISVHLKWIEENNDAALMKAKQAHSIFLEKFTAEQAVEKLLKLHNRVLSQNANFGQHAPSSP